MGLSLFFIFCFGVVCGQTTLKLGCIYPFSEGISKQGGNLQQVINIAVQEINSLEIIPGYSLSVDVRYVLYFLFNFFSLPLLLPLAPYLFKIINWKSFGYKFSGCGLLSLLFFLFFFFFL